MCGKAGAWVVCAHLPPGANSAWQVLGCSVTGASHARAGLGNQDAIAWIPESGTGHEVVLSVADGHGSPTSFRSARGARLAIEVSHALARELLAASPAGQGLSLVKDRLEEDAPRRIVREWRARVDEDREEYPFSEEEFAWVESRAGPTHLQLIEADPAIAYGTTLVTAVATPAFMAFWQIGDGDVVAVSRGGGCSRPLPRDELLLGNETTSLCSADAWRHFRVGLFGAASPLVLVSTDGFANSFQDDTGFLKFGADLAAMIVAEGLGAVDERLEGWLDQLSAMGSGDDVSLGIICRPDALGPPAPVGLTSDEREAAP